MQLISKVKFVFYYVLLICLVSGWVLAWVVPWKGRKGVTIVNAFQNILTDSKRKLNKIWIDKHSQFYNRSMKSGLQNNDIEMYSTHNEWISVVAERFKALNNTKKMIDENDKENNNKYPKSKIGDHVRLSKYKNIFAKKIYFKLFWRSFCDWKS